MIFRYNKEKFEGNRVEVIHCLKYYLAGVKLKYLNGTWCLALERMVRDCSPSQAREELTKQVIALIPEHYEFDGKIFYSKDDLKGHLESLPMSWNGREMFTVGTMSTSFAGPFQDIGAIKNHLIKEILDEI